jgi:hypothetical protein
MQHFPQLENKSILLVCDGAQLSNVDFELAKKKYTIFISDSRIIEKQIYDYKTKEKIQFYAPYDYVFQTKKSSVEKLKDSVWFWNKESEESVNVSLIEHSTSEVVQRACSRNWESALKPVLFHKEGLYSHLHPAFSCIQLLCLMGASSIHTVGMHGRTLDGRRWMDDYPYTKDKYTVEDSIRQECVFKIMYCYSTELKKNKIFLGCTTPNCRLLEYLKFVELY